MFVLALAAAALPAAAATDRFVPADPDFVVANVRQSAPDAELRELIARWRESPVDTASIALAQTFLERAHSRREPMYVGRAESVLAAAAKRPDASIETRRLYAETLQYRHEFSAAEAILDGILGQAPADAAARTQRASVRLVRGDFAGARGDCAQLLATASNQSVALACLAESHAGSGRFEQARALLAAYPLDPGEDGRAPVVQLTRRTTSARLGRSMSSKASASSRSPRAMSASASAARIESSRGIAVSAAL
jgi:Flp pilus assembly protein TadD